MKKNISVLTAIIIGIAMTSSVIAARESKPAELTAAVQSPATVETFSTMASNESTLEAAPVVNTTLEEPAIANEKLAAETNQETKIETENVNATKQQMVQEEKQPVEDEKQTVVTVSVKPTSKIVSRGGTPPKSTTSTKQTSTNTSTAKFAGKDVEVLDWWKSASSVFNTGSVVTVKDVYSGRTFKIKRTMGSNHADCEALTGEDAEIIKDIWGGYSWDVRPIHIYINGRVLAASMSAMPHAGVDSAPAFATVKNRSEGYGTGDNLDVIKDNGMNGHFDVHFLNSTRHKDGKEDSRHQSAIKVAASK